ncbi:DUF4988 domain-containing protein [Bacteroides ovatus]|nr:DUF4988 domain-containing protein [Bacteroides ovatus]
MLGSSFITLISQDADGNYIISYSDGGGETHTVTIATQGDVIKFPIITAKQDSDGKFYWAQTTDKGKTYTFILDGDGKKFPIGGTMPDVKINENGYWSVNGSSTGVLANDLSNMLFKSAYIDDKTGEAVFILADGTGIADEFAGSTQHPLQQSGIQRSNRLYHSRKYPIRNIWYTVGKCICRLVYCLQYGSQNRQDLFHPYRHHERRGN